jgi:hypothetical protein
MSLNTGADITVGGSQILAGSTADYKFPAGVGPNGLPVGTQIHVSPLAPLDPSWVGLMWLAFVSAVNVITVRVANVTTSPITPVAQGFRPAQRLLCTARSLPGRRNPRLRYMPPFCPFNLFAMF